MAQFSISDLEQLSGIKAHTIRMWEQRYDLLRPVRTATNIRTYSEDDLRRLLNVTTLCGRGQRISQVARLTDEEIKEAMLACCEDAHDYHRQVNALLAATLSFDEQRLDRLFTEAADRLGFEHMMLYVAYPLLQRIGIMWLTGLVKPAQEHLLAHLLRQKISAATDALSSVPERYQPDAIVTVLTLHPERGRLAEFASEISGYAPGKLVVLFGPLARQEGLVLPENCVSPLLMTDFMALIPVLDQAPVTA